VHEFEYDIVEELFIYLKQDNANLDFGEVTFVLKLLRKYISRENQITRVKEVPIFLWTEIDINDLRKIYSLQDMYSRYGLT